MRGLRPPAEPACADIESGAFAAMDRRLLHAAEAPVAVAVSGGGDSLALLLLAKAWAREHGRRLIVLHVDHRLQPQSRAWAQACADTAARLGTDFRSLSWDGDKPGRGLPAAARLARHRLLADAAREAGAGVILLGHTAGDLAETLVMRAQGSTTPLVREWAPSPVWPEGRGLFLLRPLLGAGREQIRAWLEARGECWIDDPANLDLRYARARARAAGATGPDLPAPPAPDAASEALATRLETGDVIAIDRDRLRQAAPDGLAAFLSAACLSAGGGERPPRSGRVRALANRLRAPGEFAATLAGARIEAEAGDVHFLREAGEAARGGLGETPLNAGLPAIWDGRYEIVSASDGLVRRLAQMSGRLPQPQQRALQAVRARARGALPLVLQGEAAACPPLGAWAGMARFLGHARLLAACGAVPREPLQSTLEKSTSFS